jgi:hypothetical protein
MCKRRLHTLNDMCGVSLLLNLIVHYVIRCVTTSSSSWWSVCRQHMSSLSPASFFLFLFFLSPPQKIIDWSSLFFGIYDLFLFFILYFFHWLFNKSFVFFQFSPSISICNKLCFSIWSLFFWFFTWSFYIYFFNFTLKSKFSLCYFFQFDPQLFFFLFKLFLSSI